MVMQARVRVPQRRTRNGNRSRKSQASGVVPSALKAWGATFLVKMLLKRSVLMAIGLGTVASWWVKRRFFSPRPNLWSRLFY